MEYYYVGAYWGDRKETAQECGERAHLFFRWLGQIDPTLSRWFETGNTREEALSREVPLMPENLSQLILKHQMRRETTREAWEELGFQTILWNGLENGESTTVTLACGAFGERANNRCILHIPQAPKVEEKLLKLDPIIELFRVFISCWEPDWGVIVTAKQRRVTELGPYGPLPGWLTYLSAARGEIPPLPEPVRIIPVENRGTIIVASDEPLDANAANMEQVDLLREIAARLKAAGVMNPSK